jgi:hypothetical protein
MGETLQRLLDAVLADPTRNTHEALLALARDPVPHGKPSRT